MESELGSLKQGLKKARRNAGLTQTELASKLNVHVKTVMNWEQGKATPSLENLIQLSEELSCDLDHLTGKLSEPTHDIQFIHDQTGLSADAIKKLMSLKDTGMDEVISDILTNDGFDKLLSSIISSVDYTEMYWNGLFDGKQKREPSHEQKGIADFIASQDLIRVLDKLRERVKEKEGKRYASDFIHALQEKDRYEAVCKLHGYIAFLEETGDLKSFKSADDAARKWLKENKPGSTFNAVTEDEDREELFRIWHDTNYADLIEISYSEWRRKYGKE